MVYTKAIVRNISNSFIHGISSADLGTANINRAAEQHHGYIDCLKSTGIHVRILPALEEHPDSCFVEDVAVVLPECAIICNPATPSRTGEIEFIKDTIAQEYSNMFTLPTAAYLEGGDVLRIGKDIFVGLSDRTHTEGVHSFKNIVHSYGYRVHPIEVNGFLHLKTGVTYVENNTLIMREELSDLSEFGSYNKITVPQHENYVANTLFINEKLIIPKGYPISTRMMVNAGFEIIELDMSEFEKLDGGLTCLSLRY